MKYTVLYAVCTLLAGALNQYPVRAAYSSFPDERPTSVLYNQTLSDERLYPELLVALSAQFTDSVLRIHEQDTLMKLNYYYSLAQRLVCYHAR